MLKCWFTKHFVTSEQVSRLLRMQSMESHPVPGDKVGMWHHITHGNTLLAALLVFLLHRLFQFQKHIWLKLQMFFVLPADTRPDLTDNCTGEIHPVNSESSPENCSWKKILWRSVCLFDTRGEWEERPISNVTVYLHGLCINPEMPSSCSQLRKDTTQ